MDGDDNARAPNAAEALEQLGRSALRDLSMDGLLQTVADLTKAVMPGNPETSVLLLVRDRPTTVVHTSRLAAARFAPYDAAAAGNLHAYQTARILADNLQVALESRAVIDQAGGVLIERYQLTADRAFPLLAGASMPSNRKVRDVAEHLVRTGELLGASPDGDRGRPPPAEKRGHTTPGEQPPA